MLMPPSEVERLWVLAHREFSIAMRSGVCARERFPDEERHVALNERLVQAIWNDQLVRASELATASGKQLEVIEPGRWNTGRGPDFLDARIRIAGKELKGDIEIHTRSVDWERHGHHRDHAYNPVILHVSLQASDDRPYEDKQNGERLERLVLEQFLEPDLDTIRQTINLAEYPYAESHEQGICHQSFVAQPEAQLGDFLALAGRSRIESKIARLAAQRASGDFHQVLHQAVLTAQGYKASKTLYFLLSRRVPAKELRLLAKEHASTNRVEFYLSVFLAVANLLPAQQDLLEADDETSAFVIRLQGHWRNVRAYFGDRLIPPTRRWFAGVRPAGFPTRRLTAAAVLLARFTDPKEPLFEVIAKRVAISDIASMKPKELSAFWKELTNLLVVEEPHHYFSTHFGFGGKKQSPQALLGSPAAASLLFNAVLPLLVLDARDRGDRVLEEKCWRALYAFPALERNAVSRFMERRLLGPGGNPSLFRREIHQQALLKVFSDCCAHNERTCDQCTFLALGKGSVA
jgi:hypothetical protein